MDKESLVNNIAITSNIEYTTKVSDDGRNIKLYTSGNLKKNTEYKIILKKGTLTQKKGILEKDITHTFKTFGYVGVSDIYPRSGASGVSTSYPISITFDQPVDKSSAQNLIKVSPSMSFKYSWKGNTVTLSPTKAYEYQTRYTISVKSGIKSIDGLDSNKKNTY